MPVVRINEIVRKILSSICLLMIFIVFILCISVSEDVPINNNNFNKENDETTWSYDEAKKSNKLLMDIIVLSILLCFLVVIPCLWCLRIYFMPLNNLCNRLFRRNQINVPMPVVHFQQNGIPPFLQDIRENNEENVHQEQLLQNRNHPEDA